MEEKIEDGWERRTNKKLYELCNRLNWLGYLKRMEDTRIVKKVSWVEPSGKKWRENSRRR